MSLRPNLKHLTNTSFSTTFRTITHFRHHRDTNNHPPPPPYQDPHKFLKEDPIQVLSDLWVKTFTEPNKSFTNLTGFLTKLDLWVLAYQRTCAHVTGSFPPRNAIHSNTLSDLLSLRNAVVHENFFWNAKTNLFIRNPNDKPNTRILSRRQMNEILTSKTTPFQDQVVQELLLMILEPVFEPRFSSKSHAFRPGRSPHTVIRTIRSNFAGYLWFIRGDVSAILNNIDMDLVMEGLKKSIKDRKVLNLIRTALDAPGRSVIIEQDEDEKKMRRSKKKKGQTKKKILNENEPKPDPYWLRTFFDFAPEEAAKVPNYGFCGILSPLLANICLHELDQVIEQKTIEFFQPNENDSIWKNSISDGCHNPSWPEFVPASGKQKTRKMDYIRFSGHFLIGIRGPREEAVKIRKQIIDLCETKYNLKLDNSKIEIEHISRGIQFLDHIISRRVIYPTLRYTGSGGKIVSEKGVGTLLSITASLQQCIRQFRKLSFVKGDKDPEPLPCTPMLYSGQAHTNSQMNKFLETVADWYKYADNRKKIIGFCAYVIRSSLAKLYAARYRLKSRAKVYKIATRDLSRPLREFSNNSAPEYSDLLRMGLVDAIEGVRFSHMSLIPSCDYTPFPRNWVPDHERVLIEFIRLQNPKYFCELLKSIKRKGLRLPQDEISEILWKCKVVGVRKYVFDHDMEKENDSQKLMLASQVYV